MPEVKPAPRDRLNPEFLDPKGTYRGDLINKQNPMSDYVHDPKVVPKNPNHATFPHYNVTFPDGKKGTILITGD